MSKPRAPMPTLTEVIEVPVGPVPADTGPAPLPPDSVPMEMLAVAPVDDGGAIIAEVLDLLRPRVDALLAARIREALAPQVLRLADESAQRLRDELNAEVQALAAQALAEVLAARHPSR
jgi:hypothetical protein